MTAVQNLSVIRDEFDLLLAMEEFQDESKGLFKMTMRSAARLSRALETTATMANIRQLRWVSNNCRYTAGGLQEALDILMPILTIQTFLSAAVLGKIHKLNANILAAIV